MILNSHVDGIEAYHLADGIGNRLTVDGSGDTEVLQFVVEETNGVVVGLLIQLSQSLAERHIIILLRNLLSLHFSQSKTAGNDEKDASHGLLHYYHVVLQIDGDALKEVQPMQRDFKSFIRFPHKIETEVTCLIIIEIHPFLVLSRYLSQHLF